MILVWLLHISIIAWLLYKYSKIQRIQGTRPYFWYGVIAKILAGILFGLFYQWSTTHGGDTWAYFEGSKIIAQWGIANPTEYLKSLAGGSIPDLVVNKTGFLGQPRALLMVKIVSVLTMVTGGNYWLSSGYISLFAFWGSWTLVNRIATTYPNSAKAAVMAFIFLPGVLFWGSGISKEAVFLGGVGLLSAWFWPFFGNGKIKVLQLVAGVILLLLLFNLKYYYVAVFIPVMLSTIIHDRIKFGNHKLLTSHISWVLIFVMLVWLVSWLHPNLQLDTLAQIIKNNAVDMAFASSENALVNFREHPDPLIWASINLPWAVITGLLRPNLGDWGSFYQNLAVVEHLLILIFVLGKIRSVGTWQLHKTDWLPCTVYVVILAALISLATPNFGTLVRYQVAYLPLFVFMVLYRNIWLEKLTEHFP